MDRSRNSLLSLLAIASIVVLTGCSHRPKVVAYAPPPPIASYPETPAIPEAAPAVPPAAPASNGADEDFVATHSPIATEEGIASWYGPPYHNRIGANGKIYDEHRLSAAHRTLPLGSLIKVTNIRTGQSAVMRVTDRGPFVPGRAIDLSLASAKAVGVWLPGTAEVRIDVYATPKPIDEGGRWCVQIGAFKHEGEALRLQDRLERKYRLAKVIEFTGPTGHWVRINPLNEDRQRAIAIVREVRPAEGEAYLVRLD
jgi:rare lipoprotein A